jgi:cytochrome c-type biogenesis protein CcmH
MTLWFLMMILCSAAAVAVSYPLIRLYEARDGAAEEAAVYQDQIKEVDRDLSAGTIAEPEAKVAKAEIERRLEAVAKSQTTAQPLPHSWKLVALVACAGLVIVGGVSLYGSMGSPSLPSASAVAPVAGQNNAANIQQQVDAMIGKLRDKLKTDPNNAQGWQALGFALFQTGKFQEAADALAKASELVPDNMDYKSAEAEALVQAAQGTVTPKTEELIAGVLAKDAKDPRARYFDALGHEQSGDQQGALERWSALFADAPADAGWRDDVKTRIAELGKTMGKDVSVMLNAAPAATDQQAMILGMVQKLADRLKDNPKDMDGWLKLMRSYAVLKMPEKARGALNDALKAFDGDQASADKLKLAATELNIAP